MIPVCMGKDYVEVFSAFLYKGVSKPPYAGTCIYDNDVIIFCPKLNACAVFQIRLALNRYSPP